ncbi:MAG: hypothetical protein M1830_006676, partial [Pleopsidium flavum]
LDPPKSNKAHIGSFGEEDKQDAFESELFPQHELVKRPINVSLPEIDNIISGPHHSQTRGLSAGLETLDDQGLILTEPYVDEERENDSGLEEDWESQNGDDYSNDLVCTNIFSNSAYQRFENHLNIFKQTASALFAREPILAEGKRRIRWECSCGHRLYDDFTELRPGAVEKLEELLNSSDDRTHQKGSNSSGGSIKGLGRSIVNGLQATLKLLGASESSELPQYQLQKASSKAPPQPPTSPDVILYLLLCISDGAFATKLLHLNLCEVTTDLKLFSLLRDTYQEMRGRKWSWLSLRTMRCIKFVQLEAYRSLLVDIRKVNDMPPPEMANEYRFEPVPADVVPPIGENHLMHLYHHPKDADESLSICLSRFPKKLREKLAVCPQRGTGIGWGIQFVDGWHWKKIWILSYALFGIGSLVLGV